MFSSNSPHIWARSSSESSVAVLTEMLNRRPSAWYEAGTEAASSAAVALSALRMTAVPVGIECVDESAESR